MGKARLAYELADLYRTTLILQERRKAVGAQSADSRFRVLVSPAQEAKQWYLKDHHSSQSPLSRSPRNGYGKVIVEVCAGQMSPRCATRQKQNGSDTEPLRPLFTQENPKRYLVPFAWLSSRDSCCTGYLPRTYRFPCTDAARGPQLARGGQHKCCESD
jgi:hypothetical protein